MVFGRDGKLYIAIGERQEQDRAQNTMLHGGKVLRLNEDGTAPTDNPFSGKQGYLPEIYSVGHRSPQGLVFHPVTGELWENEHGPLGGDEINIVRAGRNYGWPLVTFGKNYDGTLVSGVLVARRLRVAVPVLGAVDRDLGVEFLHRRQARGVEGQRVRRLDDGRPHARDRSRAANHVRRERPADSARADLAQLRQRIRDVRPGPDGLLYVLTDQNPGVLLRIEPAE